MLFLRHSFNFHYRQMMMKLLTSPKVIGGAALACGVLQMKFGHADNFSYRTFVTDKSPDDLVDFYSGESLPKVKWLHVTHAGCLSSPTSCLLAGPSWRRAPLQIYLLWRQEISSTTYVTCLPLSL